MIQLFILLILVVLLRGDALKGAGAVGSTTTTNTIGLKKAATPSAPALVVKKQTPLGNSFGSSLRDEALDVYEGFRYAENTAERIDHMLYCMDRHKGTFIAAGLLWVAKNRLLSDKVATVVGKNKVLSLQAEQIAKWGTKRKFT